MFYRINESFDRKVVGIGPQTVSVKNRVDVYHPLHSRQATFKKMAAEKVITPTPILDKRAKLTDFLSGSASGLSFKLMISNKLKMLLESAGNAGVQFFPMSVIHKDQETIGYWMSNPFAFNNEWVDFLNSGIIVQGAVGEEIRKISVKDFEEFTEVKDSLKLPESISIRSVKIMTNCPLDLVILERVYGGIGYYVSEKLKHEIEEHGCTGIDFEAL